MNLEKLLAANMIRFNTKNLNERQVLKILKEQYGAPGKMANADPIIQAFINTPANWGPFFIKNVDTITSLLNKFGVTFTVTTPEKAAAWLALEAAKPRDGFVKIRDIKKLKEVVEFQTDGAVLNNFNQKMIQFNESPDEKGKVLTVGNITAGGATGNDPGNASAFNEIISYLNNFNIAKVASSNFAVYESVENFNIIPFVGRRDGKIDGGTSFFPGYVRQVANPQGESMTPGAGSLDLGAAFASSDGHAHLYAPQKYTAATGVSTGTQTSELVWTAGPETKADLPKNMFAILSIKLDASMAPLIATAIEGAKKIGQITGLRIESGASFDEKVKLDNIGFAKAVGMAPNQVPVDPTKDAEGTVTDPMSGGNAFLAYMRGKAIQTAIGNTAGVAPTMVAKVATGGDAARYAALFFNIKQPDGSTITTKDNLASIGGKTNVEQLGGQFKVVRLSL